MKRLQMILLTNGLGLIIFMFFLFGSQYFLDYFQGSPKIQSHRTIAIDKQSLKEILDFYSNQRLIKMFLAGQEILEWNRVLKESGSHVIKELLGEQEMFYEMDHYPDKDTFDRETFAQYYYHAHRKGEYGHFHLFLRQGGMPKDMLPCFYDERDDKVSSIDTFSHLIAISMDDEGYPIKLFTTNRWVTGEDWYRPDDVCRMVELFRIEHTHPSWIINKWLSAVLHLFYPQISQLIHEREQILMENSKEGTLVEALEDYNLNVLSEINISIDAQMDVLKELIAERGITIPLSYSPYAHRMEDNCILLICYVKLSILKHFWFIRLARTFEHADGKAAA